MSLRFPTLWVVPLASLLACLNAGPLAPMAVAAPPAPTPCAAGDPLPGDYDGDRKADLLVGAVSLEEIHPLETVYRLTPGSGAGPRWLYAHGGLRNADLNGDICSDAVASDGTAAVLLPGGPSGLDESQVTALPLPQSDGLDPEGTAALRVADAIAMRHDGISQVIVAGYIDDDSHLGTPFLDVFTLSAAGVPGTPQVIILKEVSGTEGIALATSGGTLAVGLPDLTVDGRAEAGGVLMFTSSDGDPGSLTKRATITQNSPGIPGKAEKGDGFGWAIDMRDGRLAVGIPREDTGGAVDAGAVQPIVWHETSASFHGYRQLTQGTPGVVGADEAKDWFGYQVLVTRGLTAAGSYDIAVGARERVGKATDAGSVTVAHFSQRAYRTLTQGARGIAGSPERGDYFGASLGVLRTSATTDTLLIGAPNERTTTAREVGYATRSDGRRLSSSTDWMTLPVPTDGGVLENWGQSFAR